MLSSNKSTIDIQDILYGGFAGIMPLPDLPDNESLILSGVEQSHNPLEQNVPEEPPEIMSYSEAIAASATDQIDIRPRIYDKITIK